MNLFEYDKSLNIKLLCGVDEVGRGPLAGDVYAAAVILPENANLPGLNDSKKLSEKKREVLYDLIVSQAISYCVASATVEEVDHFNISKAVFLAMQRAVDGLSVNPDYVLIDGNRCPDTLRQPCSCLVKGDAISASIAAASILAKVSRDRYMVQMAKQYPEYEFQKNKGYGSKDHYRAIMEHGPTPIHRKTFLKNLTEGNLPNAHAVGVAGEQAAAKHYLDLGYEVVKRNYRSTYGEIDLILKNENYLVFAEVKTRKQGSLMTPAVAVTPQKQKKIIRTALTFLAEYGMPLQPRFDVVEVIWNEGLKEINLIENAFTADGLQIVF